MMSWNERAEIILKYKGYSSQVYYSDEDKVYYGKIDGITDLVSYEGETREEAKKDFKDSVDEYLTFLEKVRNVKKMNEEMNEDSSYVYLVKMSCATFSALTVAAFSSKELALNFLDSLKRYGPFPDTTKFRLEVIILNRPLYPIRTLVTTAHFVQADAPEKTTWKDQGMS